MKIKTSELFGPALDWAVAQAIGTKPVYNWRAFGVKHYGAWETAPAVGSAVMLQPYSTDWAQGGPIIERELVHTYPRFTAGRTEGGSDVYQQDGWAAYVTPPAFWVTPRPFTGSTPLVAAMRCIVASKLGDEIDIPNQLTV